jgi:hypothetical protein
MVFTEVHAHPYLQLAKHVPFHASMNSTLKHEMVTYLVAVVGVTAYKFVRSRPLDD